MDLIIKINLDDDLYESDLEKVFEQIQWHLERRGSWLKNFGITAADGKTLGTVEVNSAPPHSDLDTIDLEHDQGLRDLTDPWDR